MGRVTFDPRIRDLDESLAAADPGAADLRPARFRLDSRLLIVVGAPHEDEAGDGIRYFAWTGSGFRLLRYVPRLQACAPSR
ncbi:MAG TPA: hypothetical protein VGS12_15065 [Caulobacteraceae bacterium]|nr:hypothetical protein [Caulobacteraceae bacterium]